MFIRQAASLGVLLLMPIDKLQIFGTPCRLVSSTNRTPLEISVIVSQFVMIRTTNKKYYVAMQQNRNWCLVTFFSYNQR